MYILGENLDSPKLCKIGAPDTVEVTKDKMTKTANMYSENDFQHCFDSWKSEIKE